MSQEKANEAAVKEAAECVVLMYKGMSLTLSIFAALLEKLNESLGDGSALGSGSSKVAGKHGKQSVKSLVGGKDSVTNMPVSSSSIKGFTKVAKKYGVDFALKKDNSDPSAPKWMVFFKAKDVDVLQAAFSEFTASRQRKAEKGAAARDASDAAKAGKAQEKSEKADARAEARTDAQELKAAKKRKTQLRRHGNSVLGKLKRAKPTVAKAKSGDKAKGAHDRDRD
jgi:hypothetical protein